MAIREREHTQLPIPNGWFAVAWSKDLIVGGVQAIHYLNEDLVLFRTRSGEAKVLDAYCAHLGAHLGEGGRVISETVRCPFHGWQYDGAGKCVEIPYCKKIPSKARVRSWPVQEKNGMIFLWYHSADRAPEWDFPTLEEIGHPDWSEPRTVEIEIPTHVQDSHENNNDPIHFQYVHGNMQSADPSASDISYGADGRNYRIVGNYQTVMPFGTFDVSMTRDSYGLGLVSLRTTGIPDAGLLMFSATTPIEVSGTSARSISRWLLTATNNMIDLAGEEFMKGLTDGVMQDMRIWKNKVHRANPVLCAADTYLADFRKWTKQFYTQQPAQLSRAS
jgi:phenylpropionate dioxygenase-like ring-hydroxylating dioxygenase large terminal subunit